MNKIATKFQNCSEVSAQECVYTLLSIEVCRSSRETQFVNTFPNKDRYLVLKDKRWLELIDDPNSMDVFKKSVIDHYINRPLSMNDVCLADFVGNFNYVSKEEYKKLKNPNKLNLFSEDEDEVDDDLYEKIMENMNLAELNGPLDTSNLKSINETKTETLVNQNNSQTNSSQVNSQVLKHNNQWNNQSQCDSIGSS